MVDLLPDQCNAMTSVLTTSFMANNWPALRQVGAWNIYYHWGSINWPGFGTWAWQSIFGGNPGGDDNWALYAAQSCAGVPSPNDGFISANSATANSSRPAAFVAGYWADQSHSENRRCDHTTSNNSSGASRCFADGVFWYSPY
jgi:hypothetical protein